MGRPTYKFSLVIECALLVWQWIFFCSFLIVLIFKTTYFLGKNSLYLLCQDDTVERNADRIQVCNAWKQNEKIEMAKNIHIRDNI